MYCRNCGKEINPNAAYCTFCGQPVGDGGSSYNGQEQQGYSQNSQGGYNQQGYGQNPYGGQQTYNFGRNSAYGNPNSYYDGPIKPSPDGYAVASLVLGIISFFILPLIGGILAIVFGNKSLRENGPTTMAKAGKILGIISLVLIFVAVVIIVVAAVLLGVGMMGGIYYNL
ncbi:MAG: DUF4190 domain-containing protein [Clostridiales bacterium]|nr:DUF4190 domain-containing protein [Clostridiales bacterium]